MASFTPYLLVAWVLVVLGLFPAFRPHRAVIVALLLGLLLLPEVGSASATVSGIRPVGISPLHFTKDLTISYALLFAVVLYDPKRLLSGRPRWFDIPMMVWCVCPLASALTNDPPPDGSWAVRDGLSQVLQQTVTWGVPYLVGRLYFTDLRALRELALGVVLAAVAYAPLCLAEIRLSPQLHRAVYGFAQHDFVQTVRFGGYRPMVFFKHGLTLATWMVTALLMGAWLWWTGASERSGGGRDQLDAYLCWFVLLLLPMAVLLKSTGALVLGAAGWAVLCLGKLWPTRLWLVLLMPVPLIYVAARTSGAWTGQELVAWVRTNLSADRAQSLSFRLKNEEELIKQALKRPAFGWGGWGRARPHDEEGKDNSVTDGLWIITLGDRGFVGLAALGAVFLLPVLRFAWLFPPGSWSGRLVAPAAVCAVVFLLWSIDALMNGGFNHLYPLIAGGVAGLTRGQVKGPAAPPPVRQLRQPVRRVVVRARRPVAPA
jgi:hypothetical protein